MMFKNRTLWFGIVISLALLAVVFYGTDFATISNVFRTANYTWLLPALGLYFIGVALRALRWHFLLRSIKPVGLSRLFQVTIIGYMVNDLLPLRVGELARAYVVGEMERLSKTSTLVTILLERILDGVTMVILIGLAALFLPLNEYLKSLLLVGSILFASVIVILVVVAGLRQRFDALIHHCMSRFPVRWSARGLHFVDSFFHGLAVLRNPFDAIAALMFSIVAWLFEAGMYFVLARGFPIELEYPVFVLATAVANLVTIIPSTPGYIGVFDAPVKSILTLFGVDASVAASYTLLLHAALIVPVVLLGLVFTWRLGLNLARLSRRREVSLENV